MHHPQTFWPPKGFTALELMVVIAIVAILASLALPSFGTVLDRYRVRTAIEDLTASIYLGRSEGIRRGGEVTLAKTSGSGCTSSTNKDWSCGWELFVDANSNGTRDAGEQQLQAPKLPKGVTITRVASAPFNNIQFNRWGTTEILMNSFVLYPSHMSAPEKATASVLCMSSGGRIRNDHGATDCV